MATCSWGEKKTIKAIQTSSSNRCGVLFWLRMTWFKVWIHFFPSSGLPLFWKFSFDGWKHVTRLHCENQTFIPCGSAGWDAENTPDTRRRNELQITSAAATCWMQADASALILLGCRLASALKSFGLNQIFNWNPHKDDKSTAETGGRS